MPFWPTWRVACSGRMAFWAEASCAQLPASSTAMRQVVLVIISMYSDGGIEGRSHTRCPGSGRGRADFRPGPRGPGRGSAAAAQARVAPPLDPEDVLHHLLLDRGRQVDKAAAGAPPGVAAA